MSQRRVRCRTVQPPHTLGPRSARNHARGPSEWPARTGVARRRLYLRSAPPPRRRVPLGWQNSRDNGAPRCRASSGVPSAARDEICGPQTRRIRRLQRGKAHRRSDTRRPPKEITYPPPSVRPGWPPAERLRIRPRGNAPAVSGCSTNIPGVPAPACQPDRARDRFHGTQRRRRSQAC